MLQWLLFIVVSLIAGEAMGAKLVLYTYDDKPPYYLHDETSGEPRTSGLYVDLARLLNSHQQEVEFQVTFLPRRRLQRSLENETLDGAVIGVNPQWFNDVQRTRYLWSVPFMRDKEVFVVRKGAEFAYRSPSDLVGKTLALPRGYYFWGISEMVADGKISAQETVGDVNSVRMLLSNRVNATILSGQLRWTHHAAYPVRPV